MGDFPKSVHSIVGTANQIIASRADGDVVLSGPQNLHSGATPQFAGIEVGHASDTTLLRTSAGVLSVEGVVLARHADKLSVFAATTSAELAGVISDETGSGKLTFATAPTFPTTITVGEAAGATGQILVKGLTSGTATIKVADVAGTPTLTFPTASGTFARLEDKLSAFAATTSAELASIISDETGSGLLTFATAPTFPTTITVGAAGGTTGSILYKGTTSGTVTVKVADAAGTWTWTLPANDGDSGQFLQTDGSGVSSWATVTAGISGSLTSGRITVGAGASSVQDYANLTYDGTSLLLPVGPHGIGAGTSGSLAIRIGGTWTKSGPYGIYVDQTLEAAANTSAIGLGLFPTFTEAGSGTHTRLSALQIAPVITAGSANVTDANGIEILTFAAQATTDNASSLNIAGAPTGATNNWAINSTGRVKLISITAESGTNDAVCRVAASGEIEYNSGVSTCLVSSLRFKDRTAELSSMEAWQIVDSMRPGAFTEFGAKDERFGFAAEDVHDFSDRRLVYYEPDGKTPRAVDYERYTAVLTKTIQDLRSTVALLSARLDTLAGI